MEELWFNQIVKHPVTESLQLVRFCVVFCVFEACIACFYLFDCIVSYAVD